MRAMVTGATGFVGTHLVRHLRDCGDEVQGIDRENDVTGPDQHARRVPVISP